MARLGRHLRHGVRIQRIAVGQMKHLHLGVFRHETHRQGAEHLLKPLQQEEIPVGQRLGLALVADAVNGGGGGVVGHKIVTGHPRVGVIRLLRVLPEQPAGGLFFRGARNGAHPFGGGIRQPHHGPVVL